MIQIQPMLRLNGATANVTAPDIAIQIQPMLRLNIPFLSIYVLAHQDSNTTNVKVKRQSLARQLGF